MNLPIILINFKSYKEATGDRALCLAEICEELSTRYKTTIAVVPQYIDLKEICRKVEIPVFAQHIDAIEKSGAYTGHVVAENLKEIGTTGTLINHSEKKLKLGEIEKCVEIARKNDLISVCCAAESEEAEAIARFNPDFIAIEPPELIGSGISVSTAKPEVVVNSIKNIQEVNPKIKVLCGAGISSGEDVRKALELGTCGVLVASAVVKASNPEKILEELVKAGLNI